MQSIRQGCAERSEHLRPQHGKPGRGGYDRKKDREWGMLRNQQNGNRINEYSCVTQDSRGFFISVRAISR